MMHTTGTLTFREQVEAVYRSDGERLYRAVLAYAASRSVADDAVAEAFAQLLRRGGAVRDPRAWVWRAAFRIAAGELQRARRNVNELPAELASTETPGDMATLRAEIGRLSPKQRGSIILHDYTGYSAREVAEIVGSTEAAVRVHLLRARRALRLRLTEVDRGALAGVP